MTIKVLIIDDSPLIRGLLTEILSNTKDIEVVGTAEDPYDARDKIKILNPDVLTLDIEMPKMNGISFLHNLMRLRPMPVIMVSTLTEAGAPATLEALELGALDYVAKPKVNVMAEFNLYAEELIEKIRAASKSIINKQAIKPPSLPSDLSSVEFNPNYIVAIGASTGGTEAIKKVITSLPKNMSPIVITQHIPPVFSKSFANRLNSLSKMTVHEATHKQIIEQGHIYIAPGDRHLTIKKTTSGYICQLDDDEKINRHKPAVDKLFTSVAEQTKGQATGVLLTGMGADGAQGLLKMKQAGCKTIAQNEASSIVWGMPGAAVKLNAANKITPLNDIASLIIKTCTIKAHK
ncbi:chemotaxis response regulator protein-glutamate methylesterase [Catenovulum sp. 2E275]|uniref:protein-glutamate methylesterase/protein-glutamine glutaminase n=1 Tax=Catenovulum sp. 2E275 TaxID=2980497 RepID=UPI0021D09831|nr:chemotaxis response regulator protein-glutamate methylesterase [Catenovulum sp. 2E275]MCU4675513.1 chemotaxis response regulator protein-glutamate methylesterase [Catenovulum sp. 2E275]